MPSQRWTALVPLLFTLGLLARPVGLTGQASGDATRADERTPPADPVATVPDSNAVQVLVLGSFHFNQTPDHYDILSEDKQAEVGAVVDALAAFRPTKVAVEVEVRDSTRMDSLYRAYREGGHELAPNEYQQLGFRLAERMAHDRLWAIDFKYPWPQDKVDSFAERYDSAYVAYQEEWRRDLGARQDSLYRHASLSEILRWLNGPDFLSRLQAMRTRTMEVDAGGTYVGLEPETSIWHRNMRIFANLAHLAEPGDRIVVVYGAGHGYFFRKWVLQHPDMAPIEPADYLP